MATPKKKSRATGRFADAPRELSGEFQFGPPESAAEEKSRLRREEEAASHQLWKERMILHATQVVAGSGLTIAVAVLVFAGHSELRNWATATITSIISAYLGYWSGSQARPSAA